MSSKHPSLFPFRYGLLFGVLNAVNWNISLGAPLILFTEMLGGSTFQVGLVYAMVFLLLPAQILFTRSLSYFGFKKQMVFGWGFRTVFLIIPLGIAILRPEEPTTYLLWALIFSVFGFCLVRAFGSCGLFPWFYAWLPNSMQGRYFAVDQALSGLTSVLTLFFCAAITRWIGGFNAFIILYIVAIIGSLGATYALSKVPDTDKPARQDLRQMWAQAKHLIRDLPPFRTYLTVNSLYLGMAAVLMPFTIFYLKAVAGLSNDLVLTMTGFQFCGYITASYLLRNLMDRMSLAFFFCLAILTNILVFCAWFLIVGNWWDPAVPALFLLFFATGITNIVFTLSHLKYLPTLFTIEERPLAISIQSSLQGLLAGSMPILCGLLFRSVGTESEMNTGAFLVYIGISILIFLIFLPLYARLKPGDKSDASSIQIPTFLYRPFRFVSQLVHLPQSKNPKR